MCFIYLKIFHWSTFKSNESIFWADTLNHIWLKWILIYWLSLCCSKHKTYHCSHMRAINGYTLPFAAGHWCDAPIWIKINIPNLKCEIPSCIILQNCKGRKCMNIKPFPCFMYFYWSHTKAECKNFHALWSFTITTPSIPIQRPPEWMTSTVSASSGLNFSASVVIFVWNIGPVFKTGYTQYAL